MGLAATRSKQRFGLDPRNTTWSNDTTRFGHQYLEKLGWKPGKGLGIVPHATKTHIKVSIKDDNLGLGAKIKKTTKTDEFDSGECAGLDVFQRILGRLNGKEVAVANELDIQKKERIINGKWGIHFIKGEVLASTWDTQSKTLKTYRNTDNQTSRESDSDDDVDMEKKKRKDKKKDKKKKDNKKDKSKINSRNSELGDKKKKEKKEKKEKKDNEERKKVKKSRADKKSNKEDKVKEKKEAKKIRKRECAFSDETPKKKPKKFISQVSDSSNSDKKITSDVILPQPSANAADATSTRLSVRSKWIKQKRASVMDPKALNEIFMVTS